MFVIFLDSFARLVCEHVCVITLHRCRCCCLFANEKPFLFLLFRHADLTTEQNHFYAIIDATSNKLIWNVSCASAVCMKWRRSKTRCVEHKTQIQNQPILIIDIELMCTRMYWCEWTTTKFETKKQGKNTKRSVNRFENTKFGLHSFRNGCLFIKSSNG